MDSNAWPYGGNVLLPTAIATAATFRGDLLAVLMEALRLNHELFYKAFLTPFLPT